MKPQIFCFWTGDNPMSETRKECLSSMANTTESQIILVTPETLPRYILKEHPLHPAYPYLSAVHRADYLRTYFMHFYGGGYADIKHQMGSWRHAFETFSMFKWVYGYHEIGQSAVCGPPDVQSRWKQTIGLCAFICRPNTPLTRDWFLAVNSVLDRKFAELQLHPATNPRDHSGLGTGYPLAWSELLGQILHPLLDKYLPYVAQRLPRPYFEKEYL
jgi:hypothetical protein